MGHAANRKNVLLCLDALENVLAGQGVAINSGVAAQAAIQVYKNT